MLEKEHSINGPAGLVSEESRMSRVPLDRNSPDPPGLKSLLFVASVASAKGFHTRFIPYNEQRMSRGVKKTELYIGPHLCGIQRITNIQQRKEDYEKVATTGVMYESLRARAFTFFHLVRASPQALLIIPNGDLLDHYFPEGNSDRQESVRIPYNRGAGTLFPFWDYRDAWHLLSKRRVARAA